MGEFSLEVDQSHSQENTKKIFFVVTLPREPFYQLFDESVKGGVFLKDTKQLRFRVSERGCLARRHPTSTSIHLLFITLQLQQVVIMGLVL